MTRRFTEPDVAGNDRAVDLVTEEATHLIYDLPREVWEGDIDAALNWARTLPAEGPEALIDETEDNPVFGAAGED